MADITAHVAAAAADVCELVGIRPTAILARMIAERLQELVEVEFDAAAEENERVPEC